MNCEQIIEVILAIGRVTVLIIGMLGGIFSIYLGWLLYRDRVASKTSGEASFKELRISLTAAGPGVFLALFGAYLLVSIVNHKLDLTTTEDAPVINRRSNSSYPSEFGTLEMRRVADKQGTASSSTTASSTANPCIIRRQIRVLYDGGPDLNSSEISESLSVAAKAVNSTLLQATDAPSKAELRRAVAVLNELRAGIVK